MTPRGGRGRFVVFEGLDGAGTTTQLLALQSWLSRRGVHVEVTREPSSGPIGSVLRQVIDHRITLTPDVMALAFAADRLDHLNNSVNGVQRSLTKGHWVLCDRYVLSSLAYQAAQGVDVDWLVEINAKAIEPDLTIFVDTNPETCMRRIRQRSTREELFHDEQKLTGTLAGYRSVVARNSFLGSLITVDGNAAAADVSEAVVQEMWQWLRDVGDPLSRGCLGDEAVRASAVGA